VGERGVLRVDANAAPRSAHKVILSGVLINIFNPKLSIFFFAFLPQFVNDKDPDALWRMVELGAVFMLATFVVFVCYGVFAASIRRRVLATPRILTWMRRSFAAAFAALGLKLALAEPS